MLPCEDVRNLIDEYLAGTLDEPRRRAVARHLATCPPCHRAVEEARLAGMVLREAAHLPAPPDLAANIKAAARTRLFYRPRPLHERALGSPAFMATCASLLCGAIICLVAIIRVGSVPADSSPLRVEAAPTVEVHSLVRVERPESLQFVETAAHENTHRTALRAAGGSMPNSGNTQAAPVACASRATPREARYARAATVRTVSRLQVQTLAEPSLALATQRISLPGPVAPAAYSSLVEQGRSPSASDDLPAVDAHLTTVDLAGTAPAGDAQTSPTIDLSR